MSNSVTHEQAERRANLVFFVHLGIFVAVNALLAYLNLSSDPGHLWFYWPLGGWGIGLIAHAVGVFGTHRVVERTQERMERRQLKSQA